ncbi:MAG TPA: hypothetical protein VHX65_09900 [Pirellulales bacterium]|nr:hypothetical protein [Pirellulales bacterium]
MKGIVILFWIATMSWLVVAKVLPPLERGDPPTFRSVYGNLDPQAPPISWTVDWNDRPIGWAASRVLRNSSGLFEVHSRLHVARWPVEEMLPVLLRAALRDVVSSFGGLELDAFNRIEIDPLNRLVGFRSTIHIKKVQQAIVIEGSVEGKRLKLHVDAGGVTCPPSDHYLPSDALVGDELSPQATLVGLHIGQTWTVPVYNPLHPEGPLEVLEATVRGHESMRWDGQSVDVLTVIYQSDSGSALGTSRTPHGKLWVAHDGTVLRQEIGIFGSRLTFLRLSPGESAKLTAGLDDMLIARPPGRHAADANEPPNVR